nr:MAG TPA: hypothetical protein [Caudoviricetes sp.]
MSHLCSSWHAIKLAWIQVRANLMRGNGPADKFAKFQYKASRD